MRFRSDRPWLWAHRGADHADDDARVVENTVPAFAAARDVAADGIELDVHVCRDGEVVVFHDPDLNRLAGRPETVDSLSWAEVRGIRLLGPASDRDPRIPRLVDVVDFVGGEMAINIEIKPVPPRRVTHVVDRVLAALTRVGAASSRGRHRLLISSFHPLILAQVQRVNPELATAYLFHGLQRLPLRRGWPAYALGACALHPHAGRVTARRLSRWRALGLAVNAWTIDDEAEAIRLAALGVDGLITNHVRRLRAALAGPFGREGPVGVSHS